MQPQPTFVSVEVNLKVVFFEVGLITAGEVAHVFAYAGEFGLLLSPNPSDHSLRRRGHRKHRGSLHCLVCAT